MVTITREENNFVFEINGWHKLWALKSQLKIPAENIVSASPNTRNLNTMIGLRMPGTHLPGLITAGTYITKDGTIFCDVMDHAKSILVKLSDEHYKQLIIEVEDPEAAIRLLTEK